MEIYTERLVLKPFSTEHFESACEYACNIENTRYMIYLPKSRQEVLEFLENVEEEWQKEVPQYYEMAVFREGSHIGSVSVYFDEWYEFGELGWIIHRNYWGNNYAYEAAKALVEECVKRTGVRHYIAHCDSENHASRRIMEKLGMNLVNKYGGRKNRSSDEIREECKYEIYY